MRPAHRHRGLPRGRWPDRSGDRLGDGGRAVPQRLPRPRRHRGRVASSGGAGDPVRGVRRAGRPSTSATRPTSWRSTCSSKTTAIGVRKALLVIREIERMARESVEGQAIELDWIRMNGLRPRRPRLRPDGLQEDVLVHGHRAAPDGRDRGSPPGRSNPATTSCGRSSSSASSPALRSRSKTTCSTSTATRVCTARSRAATCGKANAR